MRSFERVGKARMGVHLILTWGLLHAVAYALAFGAGTALVKRLGRPWRRAMGPHWTERARLTYAPGSAVIWLAVMLLLAAPIMAGIGLEIFYPRDSAVVMLLILVAAMCGQRLMRAMPTAPAADSPGSRELQPSRELLY